MPVLARLQRVTEALEADSAALSQILGKAVSAFRAAEAAKKARELVRSTPPARSRWNRLDACAHCCGCMRLAAMGLPHAPD